MLLFMAIPVVAGAVFFLFALVKYFIAVAQRREEPPPLPEARLHRDKREQLER